MKRQNSNRSPIFSPKNKKKALKKQGTGIFGRFSPDNWPATKSPSSTKENTIDKIDNDKTMDENDLTNLVNEIDNNNGLESKSNNSPIKNLNGGGKYLVKDNNDDTDVIAPKPRRRRTKIVTKTDSVRKIQAHVRGYLERSGFNTRQKENLQMRVKRRVMEEKIATAIRLEHLDEFRTKARYGGSRWYSLILLPDSSLLMNWNMIMGYVTIFTILVGMLEWAFTVTEHFYWWYPFVEIFCELLFIFDVVFIQFRAAYYDEYFEVITSRTKIIHHYLVTYFLFDFVGSIPVAALSYAIFSTNPIMRRYFVYVKTFRALRLVRWFSETKFKLSAYTVVRLMVYFFLLIHVTSCFWYGWIGYYLLKDNYDCWYTRQNVQFTDRITKQYIYSMYAGLMMMLGENIDPVFEGEVIFAGVFLFLGAIIFATLVGNITLLVQQFSDETLQHNQSNLVLMQRLQRMHIPKSLRRRVFEYNRFVWERYRGKDTNALFAGESSDIPLSRSLRTEMALLAHAPVISRCPLFQDCDAGFIARISMDLRVELCGPGDAIYHYQDTLLKMYFLSFGEVLLFVPVDDKDNEYTKKMKLKKSKTFFINKFRKKSRTKSSISSDGEVILRKQKDNEVIEDGYVLRKYASLGPGCYFGEICMFFGGKTRCSVRATTFCEFQCLSRASLKNALDDYLEEKDLLKKHVKESLQHSISRQPRAKQLMATIKEL